MTIFFSTFPDTNLKFKLSLDFAWKCIDMSTNKPSISSSDSFMNQSADHQHPLGLLQPGSVESIFQIQNIVDFEKKKSL